MREPEWNSAGDVPEREVIEAVISAYHTTRIGRDFVPHIISKPGVREAFSRYIAAHEPEPVDPLRKAVQAAILEADRDHAEGTTWIDDFVKALRAGGVTMEKNNG